MGRWLRFAFIVYAVAVLATKLFSMPPNLFSAWTNVATPDFGPLQSNARAVAPPESASREQETSNLGPALGAEARVWRETSIPLTLPRGAGRDLRIRGLAANDGHLFVAVGNMILCLDPTGQIRWSFQPNQTLQFSSAKFGFSANSVLVALDIGRVYSFEIHSGEFQWTYDFGSNAKITDVSFAKPGAIELNVVVDQKPATRTLDAWSGRTLASREALGANSQSSPARLELWAIDETGQVFGLDTKNGERRRQGRLTSKSSGLVVPDGKSLVMVRADGVSLVRVQ